MLPIIAYLFSTSLKGFLIDILLISTFDEFIVTYTSILFII